VAVTFVGVSGDFGPVSSPHAEANTDVTISPQISSKLLFIDAFISSLRVILFFITACIILSICGRI
jgi:hypothetical protein